MGNYLRSFSASAVTGALQIAFKISNCIPRILSMLDLYAESQSWIACDHNTLFSKLSLSCDFQVSVVKYYDLQRLLVVFFRVNIT